MTESNMTVQTNWVNSHSHSKKTYISPWVHQPAVDLMPDAAGGVVGWVSSGLPGYSTFAEDPGLGQRFP